MSKINYNYYDITKVVNKRQHFIAKTNTMEEARRIAKMEKQFSKPREVRIIGWYTTKEGNRFKILERI